MENDLLIVIEDLRAIRIALIVHTSMLSVMLILMFANRKEDK